MDNQSFITLSKFTVEARKVIGTVNPAKLIKDPAYSEAIFQKIDESDNTDLILLGLELRNQLGMLDPEKSMPQNEVIVTPILEKPVTPEVPAEKYMFGARG